MNTKEQDDIKVETISPSISDNTIKIIKKFSLIPKTKLTNQIK